MRRLYSWLGRSDLLQINNHNEPGPLCQALLSLPFDEAIVLSNWEERENREYQTALVSMLEQEGKSPGLVLHPLTLEDPTDYAAIFLHVHQVLREHSDSSEIRSFHLSPGTPAMASVWMVVSQSSFPAQLIQSSRERGVRVVELPFILQARTIAEYRTLLAKLMEPRGIADPAFSRIVHQSETMDRLIQRAAKAARFEVPVLILGESGTGKELMSRSIHHASPRNRGPFVAVNCGAIPPELMESQLFGHKRGAFTGADRDYDGYFVQADGGTLFLDEVGELPLALQVKLLRVLEDGEVTPLGARGSIRVNVRILSATNRNLPRELGSGAFRTDLFFRLGVAILNIPPLRERKDDLDLLIGRLLADINREFASLSPEWLERSLTPQAREELERYSWPGNIRQLMNTLRQACLWSTDSAISGAEIRELLPREQGDGQGSMTAREDLNPSLQEQLDILARRLIQESLHRNSGSKVKAARELGLNSHQTLTNWMRRLHIEASGDV